MKTSKRTHEGRVALVIGAGQEIGQALALAFAERGAKVIVTDLTFPRETVNKIWSSPILRWNFCPTSAMSNLEGRSKK